MVLPSRSDTLVPIEGSCQPYQLTKLIRSYATASELFFFPVLWEQSQVPRPIKTFLPPDLRRFLTLMAARRSSTRTRTHTQLYDPTLMEEKHREQRTEKIAKNPKTETQTMEEAAKQKARKDAVSRMLVAVKPGDEVCHDKKGQVWKVTGVGKKTVGLEELKGLGTGKEWDMPASTFAEMIFGQTLRPNLALALAMGLHPRLGGDSLLASLPIEVFRMVHSATNSTHLSLIDTTPAPIPINLVLSANCSPIAIEAPEGKKLRNWSAMSKAVEATLNDWKWKEDFDNGFGTITPTAISMRHILALATPQMTDGFRPLQPDEADFPTLRFRIFAFCDLFDKPGPVLKAYALACKRGDPVFDLAFERVWTCRVMVLDDDSDDSDGWM